MSWTCRPVCMPVTVCLPSRRSVTTRMFASRWTSCCLRVAWGLSALLSGAGRHADAVESALAAISAEPLRESAQRALVEAYLDERNWCEVRRALDAYRDLLARELGVAPSADLIALVRDGSPVRSRPVRPLKKAAGNPRVSGGRLPRSDLVSALSPPA